MRVAQDREEQTMELSLFAEAFSEMLSRDYGEIILAALYKERCARPPSLSASSHHTPSTALRPLLSCAPQCLPSPCCPCMPADVLHPENVEIMTATLQPQLGCFWC